MPEQSYSKPQPEEINLQNYAIVLKRRWLPASFVLIASVSLATLFALMQKPAYQATGRMIFQSDRSTTLTGGAGEKIGSLESLKTLGTPIDTQVVVVQSLPIIEETITKLDLKKVFLSILKFLPNKLRLRHCQEQISCKLLINRKILYWRRK